MRSRLSLFSMGCGLFALSGAVMAQSETSSTCCKKACHPAVSAPRELRPQTQTTAVAPVDVVLQPAVIEPVRTCVQSTTARTQVVLRPVSAPVQARVQTTVLSPVNVTLQPAVSMPVRVHVQPQCTVVSSCRVDDCNSKCETIKMKELVRRLGDDAQRDAAIAGLRARAIRVDASDMEALAEKTASQCQQELCAALSSVNAAQVGELAAIAAREAQPAIAAALEAVAAQRESELGAERWTSKHAAKHKTSAHAARQDPDDSDDDDHDADNDNDNDNDNDHGADMDDDHDATVVWAAPGVMDAQAAEELATSLQGLESLSSLESLGVLESLSNLDALAEMGDVYALSLSDTAPEADGQQSLNDRVRALELKAHGQKSSSSTKQGDDRRSLEERVSELERLLRDKQDDDDAKLDGVYHVAPGAPHVKPGKKSPGQTPRSPVPPSTPAPPTVPTPHAGHAPLMVPPEPPVPAPAPRAYVRIPRGDDGEFKYYSMTPGANGQLHVDPKELRGLYGLGYAGATPEMKEKIKRGKEKAERALEKARSEQERVQGERDRAQGQRDRAQAERDRAQVERERARSERENAQVEREKAREQGYLLRKNAGADAHAPQGVVVSPDSRARVETLMREMRGQMDELREEMNRMRSELERLPRNESR